MANGDITYSGPRLFEVKLLDGQTATHTGVWVEVPPGLVNRNFFSTTLEEGATDALVDIHMMNAATKPADATDGVVLLAMTISVQGGDKISGTQWVKAKKTQGTTPVATTVTMRATRSA